MGLLNMDELMSGGPGGYPMRNGRPVGRPAGWRTDRSFEVQRRSILSGMGAFGKGGGTNMAQLYQDGLNKYNRAKPEAERAVVALVDAKRALDNYATQARALASAAGDEAIDIADRVAGFSERANSQIRGAREAVSSAVAEVERAKTAAGSGGALFGPDTVAPLEAARDMAVSAMAEVSGYAEEAQNAIKQIRVIAGESQRQGEAVRRDAEAVRLQQEAEERKRALDEAKFQREQERLEKLDADRAAREEAARLRQEQLEQQAIEEARVAREEAARQRAEEIEVSRAEAAIQAEERKYALEQEKILREQDAQLRREERESELQKLMAMQELAAKGLSVPGMPQPDYSGMFAPGMMPGMYPPGYPAVPGVPGAGFQTYPGTQPGVTAAMYPGGVPAGYAPPGMAIPGGYAPPGYAAMPPAFAQSEGLQPAGQAAAPPGFQWAAFDPSAEMFGLGRFGDLKPTLNPTLQGGLIEEGYSIIGPDANSNYQLVDPSNRSVGVYSEDRIYAGEIRHGANVVFVPPQTARPQGPQSQLPTTIATEVGSALRAGLQTYKDIEAERLRTKQAKYGQFAPPMAMPGYGAAPTQIPGYVWLAGAVGLGALAFWALGKKKSEPTKAA